MTSATPDDPPLSSLVEAEVAAAMATSTQYRRLLLAFSGGMDSTVLFDVLRQLRWPLRAVHVDHGLQPQAAPAWRRHVQQQCTEWGVALSLCDIDGPPPQGESVEAWAREQRYRALAKVREPDEWLVSAQHQTDQVETVLLQLVRGAGPAGLAGMPVVGRLASMPILRPLLSVPVSRIHHYAVSQALSWFEDPSNAELAMDRNYLRHSVLPLLRRRWPGIEQTVARAAGWQGDGLQLQQAVAAADLRKVTRSRGVLRCAPIVALDATRQANLLRFALRAMALPVPEATRLQALCRLIASAAPRGEVCWPGAVMLRYRDDLHLLSHLPSQPPDDWQQPLNSDSPIELPAALGVLRVWFESDAPLVVRFRRRSERIGLAAGAGHTALAKWYQQQGIPPWERQRLPLIAHADTVDQSERQEPVLTVGTYISEAGRMAGIARIEWDRQPHP
ncbi:MAG: tRNA lysidine(34) synthetase TilS [Pseudomonadota bacterium]